MSKLHSAQALIKTFFEKHPSDAARALEALPHEEARNLLRSLPPEAASQAVEYLNPHSTADLLENFSPEQARPFLEKVSPKQMTDILHHLSREKREEFLQVLDPDHARTLRALLTYDPDTAGGMMSPGATALSHNLTVGEAIRKIRSLGKKRPLYYVYVTGEDNKLEGVLGMRDLLLADFHTTIGSITLKDVISVPADMDREKVVQLATKHRYLTVPVVDAEKHLLGIIHSEDLMEAAEEEASEDLQKMFGAGGDEAALSPVAFSIKKRLPWLHVNLATAFLAAAVVGLFEGTIAKLTALAVFLPVVAGQGGNAGAQTLAVVIRGLALGEIEKGILRRVVLKEAALGLINGLVVGIVTAGIGYLWQGNLYFGLIIGLAMVVNMALACIAGAGIPIAMKVMGWDPAQSSSIILTTVTDVVGFFAFLGLAALFADFLVK